MFNRFINNQLKVSDMKNNAYKKIRQIVSLFMFSILSIGFVIGCSEPEEIKGLV